MGKDNCQTLRNESRGPEHSSVVTSGPVAKISKNHILIPQFFFFFSNRIMSVTVEIDRFLLFGMHLAADSRRAGVTESLSRWSNDDS